MPQALNFQPAPAPTFAAQHYLFRWPPVAAKRTPTLSTKTMLRRAIVTPGAAWSAFARAGPLSASPSCGVVGGHAGTAAAAVVGAASVAPWVAVSMRHASTAVRGGGKKTRKAPARRGKKGGRPASKTAAVTAPKASAARAPADANMKTPTQTRDPVNKAANREVPIDVDAIVQAAVQTPPPSDRAVARTAISAAALVAALRCDPAFAGDGAEGAARNAINFKMCREAIMPALVAGLESNTQLWVRKAPTDPWLGNSEPRFADVLEIAVKDAMNAVNYAIMDSDLP